MATRAFSCMERCSCVPRSGEILAPCSLSRKGISRRYVSPVPASSLFQGRVNDLAFGPRYIGKIPDTKPATCNYWVVGMKAFHYTTPNPTTLNPEKNQKLHDSVMKFMRLKEGRFIHLDRNNYLDRHLSDVRANSPGVGGHCQKIDK